MNKLTKDDMKELMAMRELTVREFFEKIKQHPTLSGLLTTAGVWFVTRTLLLIMIWGNVIYIVTRIFNMVLN
jgi:uncharacterized membrane protein